MSIARMGPAVWQIQRLFSEGSSTGVADTQLLKRFATARDESAFAALLDRHGPMVMTVCRGILRDASDAEDAFQATFLVLARKAGSVWAEGQLGGWLHTVAYRIAVRADGDVSRRRRQERRAARDVVVEFTRVELDDDLLPALHEEIARLPAKFRLPIVLCYLEGWTHTRAALELQCGEATLRRRLAGGRERLRDRLAQRGFAPRALAIGVSLESGASGAVPATRAQTTIRAVMRVAGGEALATVVSARVASLTQGGLTLITNGWKATAFAVFSLAAVAALAGGVRAWDDKTATPGRETTSSLAAGAVVPASPARVAGTGMPPIPAAILHANAGEAWPLTLAEAIRIALDNGEAVRVVAFGAERPPIAGVAQARLRAIEKDGQSQPAPMVIMPQNPRASVWRFRSQVMAMLHVVDEQYWRLAQAHAILSSAEQAVVTAHEIHGREQAELTAGRGKEAYVAEAAQRLEQFNLDLVTRFSDVMTTERTLRKALGLPPADNRRIIPATPPLDALFEPDWDKCLAEMQEQQPDIASIKRAIAGRSAIGKQGPTDGQIEALNQDLKQTMHEKTHSLARYFLEIDANFKQFKIASRLRGAAAQRLIAQRANYEKGQITIDRFLDAVSQRATALATEAQYKTTYNVSICALEEAKGTLLAYDNIAVVNEVRRSGTARVNENRDVTSHAVGFEPPSGGVAARQSAALLAPPVVPEKMQADGENNKPTTAGKTAPRVWSFSFSIGRDRPFFIKGTITEGAGDGPDAAAP